jgi:demethylmenaquinone methyltransferase/2-methoxy-6-polyprenyl-1,4-benzoquinol methylase
VTGSRAQVRRSYNRMSRWYDLFARSERRFTLRALELLAPQEGERMLEVGFGTGEILAQIALAVGETGRVCGIDIADEMCSRAAGKLRSRRLSERAEITCADALPLPYGDGEFDGIFSGFSLELFDTPEIPQVLSEWKRVLHPAGRVAVVSLLKEDRPAVRFYERLHDWFPAALDCRPIRPRSELAWAGFRILHAERAAMWGLPVQIVIARKPEAYSSGQRY